MWNTTKISDRMAEMIMDTAGPEHRVMGNTNTLAALMNRGLARYDRERSRETGSTTHFLTAQGVDLYTRLQRQPDARQFRTWEGEAPLFEAEEVPAVTDPTPETDMASTIKISDRMADTILAAVERDSGEYLVRGPVGTVAALMDRGLVSVHLVRVPGQVGHRIHTLTPRGLNVRERLLSQPDGREFLASVVDAAARKTEEAPAATETPAVTEYSVKIWYRSGAYEGVAHSPEDLARKIFADAVKSAGVEFAELHGPSGKLVESKTPNEEGPVATEHNPGCPDGNPFLTGLPLPHPEPLPPAPLNVSQHGEDLTAAYSAQDPADG